MNSRQLQYAVKLAEVCNFSQLADKLEISQPALSKQIQSLENELGVKLFDRNTNPLTLTPAGEYFIRHAKDLLYREDQLLRSMDKFKIGEVGKLTIGISPFRSLYLIPKVLRKVKDKYPGIQIVLHEATSDELRKEAAEGKYDFAIVNLPVEESVLDVVTIEPDVLVLAVPNDLVGKIPSAKINELTEIRFNDCKDLPFVVVGQTQEMRVLFDKLCASADFYPNIAAEVVGLNTARTMACEGIGATLLPRQFIEGDHLEDKVSLFMLKDRISVRQPAIVTKRGQHISEYAEYAMTLVTESI